MCTLMFAFAGQEKALDVIEPESPEGEDEEEEEEERGGGADEAAGVEEEQPLAADESAELPDSCKPKMKVFPGKTAAGLRIRAEPSFLVRGGRERGGGRGKGRREKEREGK